jgi:hypothetical protein
MFCTVHCAPPVSFGTSDHSTGTETPSPGRARADQAQIVVAPKPLRR